MGFDYVIRYKKGSDNIVADVLSRLPASDSSCHALTLTHPQWTEDLISSYESDDLAQQYIAQLLINPIHQYYSYQHNILRYKGRLYVGSDNEIKSAILHSLHSSAAGGHSGIRGTYSRAKSHFFLPRMKHDIIEFVSACDTCQFNKGDHSFPSGLLQPLPIPEFAWQHISLDFIEGLPLSNIKNVILVVVDRLTKYSHFYYLCHPFTAMKIAKEFLAHVFKLHGLPSSIVSDRDKICVIQFWQALFKTLGTTVKLSTSYHPQTYGQTE